jgi:hypothetical protein
MAQRFQRVREKSSFTGVACGFDVIVGEFREGKSRADCHDGQPKQNEHHHTTIGDRVEHDRRIKPV